MNVLYRKLCFTNSEGCYNEVDLYTIFSPKSAFVKDAFFTNPVKLMTPL